MVRIQRNFSFGSNNSNNNGSFSVRDIFFMVIGGGISCVLLLLVQKNIDEFTIKTSSFSSSSSHNSAPLRKLNPTGNEVVASSSFSNNNNLPDGWNPIYIFYGNMNHIIDTIPTDRFVRYSEKHMQDTTNNLWYSQHGQDIAIAKLFQYRESGYFVDLAANRAVWASNTFSLEQNFHWTGICIEPNPIYWYELSFRNCNKAASLVSNINYQEVDVTLGDNFGVGPFGGIANRKTKTSVKRYTSRLDTILEMFNAPSTIDYLSLDVEGHELMVVKDFPFDKYKFLSITVERPEQELKDVFIKNGYQYVMTIKENVDELWVHNTMYQQAVKLILNDEITKKEMKQNYLDTFPQNIVM